MLDITMAVIVHPISWFVTNLASKERLRSDCSGPAPGTRQVRWWRDIARAVEVKRVRRESETFELAGKRND